MGARAVAVLDSHRILRIVLASHFHASPTKASLAVLMPLYWVVFHLLASMLVWALAIQVWDGAPWPTRLVEGLSFSVLLASYLLITALQCRYWIRDLYQRCPVCLESPLLTFTQGASDRVLRSTWVTESVCSHGHGVLVETRWMRQFRRDDSPLEGLVRTWRTWPGPRKIFSEPRSSIKTTIKVCHLKMETRPAMAGCERRRLRVASV